MARGRGAASIRSSTAAEIISARADHRQPQTGHRQAAGGVTFGIDQGRHRATTSFPIRWSCSARSAPSTRACAAGHRPPQRIATHVAAANGATVDVELPDGDSNPVLINDPALTARIKTSISAAIGAEHVIEAKPWMGSEDFAYFAQDVPSVYFFVGATPRVRTRARRPPTIRPSSFSTKAR